MIDQLILAADPSTVADQVTLLAQDVPGGGGGMEAPPGFGTIADRIVSAAKWIGIFVCVIAVVAGAGGAALSKQRGSSEEVTERFLTIGLAIAVIAAAASIVGWILSATGTAG